MNITAHISSNCARSGAHCVHLYMTEYKHPYTIGFRVDCAFTNSQAFFSEFLFFSPGFSDLGTPSVPKFTFGRQQYVEVTTFF